MADVTGSPVRGKTQLSANGRIVIPAAMREALRVVPGETVLMDVTDGVLRIESIPSRVARIQREVARYIPPGVSLADELIAERREEARHEAEDATPKRELIRLRRGKKIA